MSGNKITTTQQLVAYLSEYAKVTPAEAEAFIHAIVQTLASHLKQGEEVHVSGLGTFKVLSVQEGNIRRVAFTADDAFKKEINSPFECFEPFEISNGIVSDAFPISSDDEIKKSSVLVDAEEDPVPVIQSEDIAKQVMEAEAPGREISESQAPVADMSIKEQPEVAKEEPLAGTSPVEAPVAASSTIETTAAEPTAAETPAAETLQSEPEEQKKIAESEPLKVETTPAPASISEADNDSSPQKPKSKVAIGIVAAIALIALIGLPVGYWFYANKPTSVEADGSRPQVAKPTTQQAEPVAVVNDTIKALEDSIAQSAIEESAVEESVKEDAIPVASASIPVASTPTTSVAETPSQEPAKEPAKEATQEVAKEPVKEAVKEPAKEATQEVAKEPVKEAVKEPVKEKPSIPTKAIAKDGMNNPRTVVVKEGERLTVIAERIFGNKAFWPYFYEVNKDRYPQAGNVPVGAKLNIPDASYWGIDSTSEQSLKKARQLGANILSGK